MKKPSPLPKTPPLIRRTVKALALSVGISGCGTDSDPIPPQVPPQPPPQPQPQPDLGPADMGFVDMGQPQPDIGTDFGDLGTADEGVIPPQPPPTDMGQPQPDIGTDMGEPPPQPPPFDMGTADSGAPDQGEPDIGAIPPQPPPQPPPGDGGV